MGLRKRQRVIVLALAAALVGGAAALVLTAMQDTIAFFVSPSDIAQGKLDPGRQFRLGGLVVDGSVHPEKDGGIGFVLTDGAEEVTVRYKGILPDLFREGQGIVAMGSLGAGGTFVASEVLAKHDETYMPPEVADALKRSGHWQEGAEMQQ